jgi:hypothetical protein
MPIEPELLSAIAAMVPDMGGQRYGITGTDGFESFDGYSARCGPAVAKRHAEQMAGPTLRWWREGETFP